MNHGFTKEQLSYIQSLMTQRNKSLRHEVSDHLDNALPVKKLQTDAAAGSLLIDSGSGPIWLPPAPGSGYGLTSDVSAPGGAKWAPQRMTYGKYEGSSNTGAIASGGVSGAWFYAPSFIADGTSTYVLEWGLAGVGYVLAGPGVNRWDLIVVDAGVEIGTLPGYLMSSNVFAWDYGQREIVFTAGTHSLTIHMRNQTGADSTAAASCGVTAPMWLRVTRRPG